VLLGDEPGALINDRSGAAGKGSREGDKQDHVDPEINLSAQAKRWLKKHKLSNDDLEAFFHIESDSVEIIGIPDSIKTTKQKVVVVYHFQGICSLLQSGDPSFDDELARNTCVNLGCYDKTNHSKSVKGFRNKITGSKTSGYKLTAPGLDEAARIIKGANSE